MVTSNQGRSMHGHRVGCRETWLPRVLAHLWVGSLVVGALVAVGCTKPSARPDELERVVPSTEVQAAPFEASALGMSGRPVPPAGREPAAPGGNTGSGQAVLAAATRAAHQAALAAREAAAAAASAATPVSYTHLTLPTIYSV